MATRDTRHTPAPWAHGPDPEGFPGALRVFHEGTRQEVCARVHGEGNARLLAASPDAYEILAAIGEFFRHHNPVDPGALVLDDDRTLGQAVAEYLARVRGPKP